MNDFEKFILIAGIFMLGLSVLIEFIKESIKDSKEKKVAKLKNEAQKLNEEAEIKLKEANNKLQKAITSAKKTATDEIRDKFFLPVKSTLNSMYNFDSMYLSSAAGRLNNAFDSNLEIKEFTVAATIKSGDHFYKNVRLDHCDCKDFQINRTPCKHILFLAYTTGVLQTNQELCQKHKDTLVESVIKLVERERALQIDIDIENKILKGLQKTENELENLIDLKLEAFPYLAGLIADIDTIHYEQTAKDLESKKRPALTAAQEIRALKHETREIIQEKKILEYKLAYIEQLFPNVNDIFDDDFNKDTFELETEETTDRVRLYLSDEEYNSLSTSDKNQLALDRYLNGRKSKWQIGRDYEMYIGHLCELRGYKVKYIGILKNFEDMGRDLIISGNGQTYIIQCKNWSKEKTIHEKHIFQLYGTIVMFNIENKASAQGIFITTTELSSIAQAVAKSLNIKVINIPHGEFPRIKCNINRTTGEKIYHLPFDQQYDKVIIDPIKGEGYATTVKEAEDKGFRRAKKHYEI